MYVPKGKRKLEKAVNVVSDSAEDERATDSLAQTYFNCLRGE